MVLRTCKQVGVGTHLAATSSARTCQLNHLSFFFFSSFIAFISTRAQSIYRQIMAIRTHISLVRAFLEYIEDMNQLHLGSKNEGGGKYLGTHSLTHEVNQPLTHPLIHPTPYLRTAVQERFKQNGDTRRYSTRKSGGIKLRQKPAWNPTAELGPLARARIAIPSFPPTWRRGLDNHTQKIRVPQPGPAQPAYLLPRTMQCVVDNDNANTSAYTFSAYAKIAYKVMAFFSFFFFFPVVFSVTMAKTLLYPESYRPFY